jgi:two-component system sensor histidine kinase CiaH
VAWNVAVLAVILIVIGFAVYFIYSSQMYTEVDHQLGVQKEQTLTLIQQYGDPYAALQNARMDTNSRTVVANRELQVMWTTECPTLFPVCSGAAAQPTSRESLTAALTNGSDLRTATFGNEPQRVESFTITDGSANVYVIQISRDVSGQEIGLHKLQLLLLFGAIAGIILSGLGSLFLANRALVPIREAFAQQRQFTADASHELRTPLALIRANAETLSRSRVTLPPEDSELVNEIILETDHLNRLIGDLLTLARGDSQSIQIAQKPVDLRALVSDVHDDLRYIAESRGIQSEVTLDGPVTVQGDEGRLRQLLLILLDNSLKYTNPGGHVDLTLGRAENHARLIVSDTGIGIPQKDLSRVFERFYRVDRAREHDSGGTGLGLAIADWIVHAHHGSIKADSEPGKGTRIVVDLPLTAADTRQAMPSGRTVPQ